METGAQVTHLPTCCGDLNWIIGTTSAVVHHNRTSLSGEGSFFIKKKSYFSMGSFSQPCGRTKSRSLHVRETHTGWLQSSWDVWCRWWHILIVRATPAVVKASIRPPLEGRERAGKKEKRKMILITIITTCVFVFVCGLLVVEKMPLLWERMVD